MLKINKTINLNATSEIDGQVVVYMNASISTDGNTNANINKNINPSMLRHSFAIHLLNNGANIAVVSKILGNSNLSSLQSYVNQINKNIRKEVKEKHPRS